MKRFFSADSFWNTPLPAHPKIDPRSEHCIRMLQAQVPRGGFWINHDYWTIPVYEITREAPLRRVRQREVQPGKSFLPVG